MSIEHWVYSPDPPIDREVLARTCAAIPMEKRWAIAFLRAGGGVVVEQSGPVTSQMVFGWVPGADAEPRIQAALAARDRATIDDLYADGVIAAVSLQVLTRQDERWDEFVEIEIEAAPPEHHAEIRHAATIYLVETSAMRNEMTLEFQPLFFRALGVMSNGLMIDPQNGEYHSTLEDIGRDGEKADAELAAAEQADAKLAAAEQADAELAAAENAERREPPRRDLGPWMIAAAVGLLTLVELASAMLYLSVAAWTRFVPHAVGVIAIPALWYGVRDGDRQCYWLLLALAAVIAGLSAYQLPTASDARAVWLAMRMGMTGLAGFLLLLPASRRASEQWGLGAAYGS